MKRYLIILFYLISNYCTAQKYTDNDQKYWFYDFINDSTIKMYFSQIGVTSCKACAEFYRIAQIDKQYFMFVGNVKDYYLDSTLFFEGYIDNTGFYNGRANYYSRNGNLLETGIYKKGIRDSIWEYYYENGEIKRTVEFDNNQARLIDFYKRNGKHTVVKGNGKYKDDLRLGYLTTYATTVDGLIKDGTFDGKWTFINSFYKTTDGFEYYENGQFTKGKSRTMKGYIMYNEPKLTFFEFIPQENIYPYTYVLGCPGFSYSQPSYKGDYALSSSFFEELIKSIENQVDVTNTENQWFMVSFNINSKKQMNNFQIKSSLHNDALSNSLTKIITSMTEWTKAGTYNNKVINYPLYIVIAFENGKLIIPQYHMRRI
jgi:antitoxin component YwqK of YwqJK toxin-antitoxin module